MLPLIIRWYFKGSAKWTNSNLYFFQRFSIPFTVGGEVRNRSLLMKGATEHAQFDFQTQRTQRQNECAYSSPVSSLTRQNGGIFKIPIVCFRFAWISPNQNRYGCCFQERFLRTSSTTYLIQQKKYCGNRCTCELGD